MNGGSTTCLILKIVIRITLPFVQNFLGPMGFAAISLFDAGNTVMCTGVTLTLTSMAKRTGDTPRPSAVVKSLLSSVPFDTYVVMTALVAFGPVSSVATAFTGKLGGDVGLPSAVNSLSICTQHYYNNDYITGNPVKKAYYFAIFAAECVDIVDKTGKQIYNSLNVVNGRRRAREQ